MFCRFLPRSAVAALALVVAAEPAAAQSILRDAETEAFFADMSAPLVMVQADIARAHHSESLYQTQL